VSSFPPRRLRATVAALAITTLAFFASAPAANAESFSTARARCAAKLHQSCYAQYLRHIPGHCYVFRGVFNHRIGRTWGCPGSPLYVW
jgi:hypothetical protein